MGQKGGGGTRFKKCCVFLFFIIIIDLGIRRQGLQTQVCVSLLLYLGPSFYETQFPSLEKSKENKKETNTKLSVLVHCDSIVPHLLGAYGVSSKHWLHFPTVVTHFHLIFPSAPIPILKGPSTCRGGGSSRNPLLSAW